MDTIPTLPKVSVCVITYNHEKYIRECICSILEQVTNFPFEIIIGDDYSSDLTRSIVSEYAERYPNIIKQFLPNHKIGGTKNYLEVHRRAIGEYIAHVDGDDVLEQGKLQTQADFLDKNDNVSMAAHAVKRIGEGGSSIGIFGAENELPQFGNILTLLKHGTYFTNSSVMYRKVNQFEHLEDREYVDFYFHLEQASKGLIYLDKRVLGSYRVHSGGISRNLAQREVIERCYEQAFDRAFELGAPREHVEVARLKRRMVFAIEHHLAGNAEIYTRKIKLHRGEYRHATLKHIVLSATIHGPRLIKIYFKLKNKLNHFKDFKWLKSLDDIS